MRLFPAQFRKRIGQRLDRLATPAPAPLDPVHQARMRWKRKLLASVLVVVPLAVVTAGILATTNVFRSRHIERRFVVPPAAAQKARDSAVGATQELTDASELEVSQLALERENPPAITGEVRNKSGVTLEAGEISFNVLNNQGAVLGSVSVTVHNIPGHGAAHFRVDVPQKGAALALVRDAHRIATKKD